MNYTVPHTSVPPPLDGRWDSDTWGKVPPLDIAHFHPCSGQHRPHVQAKLLHSERAIHVLFRVRDRFVKALCTRYGQKVCMDSCVELFVQPKPNEGYFNLEVNCGGTMLLWYVDDPTPVPGGLKSSVEIPGESARMIGVYHNLPPHIPEEITDPVEWRLQLAIPIWILEPYVGTIERLGGQEWRANLFKCADGTTQPHWASCNPIGTALNFHQPEFFGTLRLE